VGPPGALLTLPGLNQSLTAWLTRIVTVKLLAHSPETTGTRQLVTLINNKRHRMTPMTKTGGGREESKRVGGFHSKSWQQRLNERQQMVNRLWFTVYYRWLPGVDANMDVVLTQILWERYP
jgi:hypothetical protein